MKLESLHIPRTEETPEVFLSSESDASYISGRSLPENAYEFYLPVINWVKEFAKTRDTLMRLELKFDYFNSSSGRYLFEILHILEQSKFKDNYRIVWMSEKEDDLMHEKGEELKNLSDLHFVLIAY